MKHVGDDRTVAACAQKSLLMYVLRPARETFEGLYLLGVDVG